MVKYRKYFIVVGLAFSSMGMLLPRSSYAVEMNPLVISDSFRTSLLQLITLLQKLQALNPQKPPVFGNSLPKTESQAVQNPITPISVPASQQALPFIEGFSLPAPPPRSSTLKILSVSPLSGTPGTLVTITGQGFSSSMMLYGGFQSQAVSSLDGKTVTFIIAPDLNFSSDLPKVTEKVFLYLEDSSGISNVGNFSLSL